MGLAREASEGWRQQLSTSSSFRHFFSNFTQAKPTNTKVDLRENNLLFASFIASVSYRSVLQVVHSGAARLATVGKVS